MGSSRGSPCEELLLLDIASSNGPREGDTGGNLAETTLWPQGREESISVLTISEVTDLIMFLNCVLCFRVWSQRLSQQIQSLRQEREKAAAACSLSKITTDQYMKKKKGTTENTGFLIDISDTLLHLMVSNTTHPNFLSPLNFSVTPYELIMHQITVTIVHATEQQVREKETIWKYSSLPCFLKN